MASRIRRIAVLLAGFAFVLAAHIGSPDVYLDGQAGPYRLFVTVRTPTVIPGIAEIQIRSETPGLRSIGAVPLPMTGPGAKFAPVADKLNVSREDPQYFTGSLWMMAPGSWQVKITADGLQGRGTLAVPFPSVALTTRKMQAGLGAMLGLLGAFLLFGMVAIVGASVREAKLPAGVSANGTHKQKGRIAMGAAFAIFLLVVWFGTRWWTSEDSSYKEELYKPLDIQAQARAGVLTLKLHDPGWLNSRVWSAMPVARSVDDLIPDHNHLMHLYLIRQPALDVVFHLHPDLIEGGEFRLKLPSVPEGDYKLYADIVHRNGFPETLVTSIHLPASHGRALAGDDAGATAEGSEMSSQFPLPDGYRMEWIHGPKPLRARAPEQFQFRLLDAQGRAPNDMALYMEMLGHAAFVKTDGTVFAHIHPTGSVSMAAFMKAQTADSGMPGMDMDHPAMNGALPNEVSFPYGLPTPGKYRIFVQMKHGNTIETGVFDTVAE